MRTTLAINTHTLKRKHDDSANRMAEIAAFLMWETNGKQSTIQVLKNLA